MSKMKDVLIDIAELHERGHSVESISAIVGVSRVFVLEAIANWIDLEQQQEAECH